MERILITGGTGFLGKQVVPRLRERFSVSILSRSSGDIRADLTRWAGGLSDDELDRLRDQNFQAMVHMAGLYDLKASTQDCFVHNVAGTGTALRLASELRIPVFINTSSVAAAINTDREVVHAADLDLTQVFPDAYSESKAKAERVIENWNGGIRFRLNLRLGVLVGDQKDGRIERIDGPYHAAEALRHQRFIADRWPFVLPLPGRETTVFPLVPVDACAAAICQLTKWAIDEEQTGYRSLHLTPSRGLGAREFYHSVLKHLRIRPHRVALMGDFQQATTKRLASWVARLPEEELHYLLNFPRYETGDTEHLLGSQWCPEFGDYERNFWSGYEKFISHR